MTYKFYFNLEPQSKERPRFDPRSRRAYTTNKTRSYESLLKSMALAQIAKIPDFKLLDQPLCVDLSFRFKRPKTVKGDFKTTKPDLDNLVKAVDAFNGVIWKDDAQIIMLRSQKLYAPKSSIVMTVTVLVDIITDEQ